LVIQPNLFLGTAFVKLRLTEKVLAKCGLNWTKSSISTKRSRYFFNETKLSKKCGIEKYWRI